MNLATRKYNFIEKITTIDEALLEKLEKVLKSNKIDTDWANELSQEEKKEIEIGLNEADNNEFVDHNEVMNKFQKWH